MRSNWAAVKVPLVPSSTTRLAGSTPWRARPSMTARPAATWRPATASMAMPGSSARRLGIPSTMMESPTAVTSPPPCAGNRAGLGWADGDGEAGWDGDGEAGWDGDGEAGWDGDGEAG